MQEPEWFEAKNIESIDTPALMIHTRLVKKNLDTAIQISGDRSLLRPHVKTSKISEVCEMMLREGITKFKAATIAECEMLAIIGAPDVLLAFQPSEPKLERFIALLNTYPDTRFSCITDNEKTASLISEKAVQSCLEIDLYIDLNIGMNRSGIKAEHAVTLRKKIIDSPGLILAGLHAYDGHIHDTDLSARKLACDMAMEPVMDLQKTLEILTGNKIKIIAGGTPTFAIQARRALDHLNNAKDHGIIECSPGTFIFWDYGYDSELPDLPFDMAAVLATRVVSIVDAQTICVDLGHKSVASEMPFPRVQFLNAKGAISKSHSEEHMTITVSNTDDLEIGDCIYCVPKHICPTVALHEKVYVVENNQIIGDWKTVARDRTINI